MPSQWFATPPTTHLVNTPRAGLCSGMTALRPNPTPLFGKVLIDPHTGAVYMLAGFYAKPNGDSVRVRAFLVAPNISNPSTYIAWARSSILLWASGVGWITPNRCLWMMDIMDHEYQNQCGGMDNDEGVGSYIAWKLLYCAGYCNHDCAQFLLDFEGPFDEAEDVEEAENVEEGSN